MPIKLSFCYKTRLGNDAWSTSSEEGSSEDIHEATHHIVQELHKTHHNLHAAFRIPANTQETTVRVLFYKAEKGEITCTDLGSMLPKHKLDKIYPALQGAQSLKEILLSFS
ncbi:MAG: hypothetical protein AB8C84_02055 [Oligoflexales bacterium]